MKKQNISRQQFLKLTGLASASLGLTAGCTPTYVKPQVPDNFKNLRILFQGDSITDGNRGRNEDPNHIMGHGYAFSIASRVGADFPEAGFLFFNRGISGNTVPDLAARWQEDTLDLKPDVLSLLVGINDVGAIVNGWKEPANLEEFESGYRKLLDNTLRQNPDLLIVLGIPFVFPLAQRKEKWEQWKNETLVRAELVRKIAAAYNAVLIDFPSVFENATEKAPIEYWIWDGVHPTVFGHELMTREWIIQVAKRLPFLEFYRY